MIVAEPADNRHYCVSAVQTATAIAECFRSTGKNVLLIMDSLTRVAHARREWSGTWRTANVKRLSTISCVDDSALVERSGTGIGAEGSITSFYTVLADGDDTNDPVVDTARAILDGHILLSREQTQMGIYPAVDVPASVSRV